ncbi:MAG: hypothetical protein ACI8W8_001174 [Rhodothermales bacterium]|jgi:hypothetical protein
MRTALLAAILLFQAGQCLAAALVVRKNGSSFWTETAKKAGEKLIYTDDAGRDGSIAMAEISQIIPKIKRGKQYPPATVDKIVGVVETELKRFPKLKKQLSALRDEWKALQQPAVDISADITNLGKAYDASERSLPAFTDFVTKLGMLRFRDLRSTYSSDIETLEGRVKGEFYTRQHALLMKQLRPKMSIDEFVDARSLVKSLRSLGIDESRGKALSSRLEQARIAILKREMAKAKVILSGNKLPGYTAANAIIFELRERVAESAAHKATLDKALASFQAAVAKANRKLAFDDRGFPFTRSDMDALTANKDKFRSMILFSEIEPRALLFPRSIPARIAYNAPVRAPLTALFRATPPAGAKLGIAIHVIGPQGLVEHSTALPISILDARADINLAFDLRVAPEVVEYQKASGKSGVVYFSLACLPTGAETWQMLSHACELPLQD